METLSALAPEIDSTNPLPAGTHLQEFVVERVIGIGGFGIVYQAHDSLLRRTVAIKEYMPASMASRSDGNTVSLRSAAHLKDFETGKATFIDEARMLARFKHPALIEVLRFWEQNRTAYMVTPFYKGKTLNDHLRATPVAMSQAELKRIMMPVLDALAHMHAERVYHRDISPDNIMVLDNGSPILLDLGAARRLEELNAQAFTVLVKPGYAPIEQYAGEISGLQGPWTDLYGWGASAYFALTGKPPPPSASRVMSDKIIKLTDLRPEGFSPDFLAAIDATLAVRPDDRPQSVEALKELLALEPAGPGLLADEFQPTAIQPEATDVQASFAAAPSETSPVTLRAPALSAVPVTGEAPVEGQLEALIEAHTDVQEVPAEPAKEDMPAQAVKRVTGTRVMTDSPRTVPDPSASSAAKQRMAGEQAKVTRSPLSGLLIAGSLACLAGGIWWMTQASPSQGRTPASAAVVAPAAAVVQPPRVQETGPSAASPAPVSAQTGTTSSGEAARSDASTLSGQTASSGALTSDSAAAPTTTAPATAEAAVAEKPALARLAIKPWGEVFVNGVNRGVSPPLKSLSLPAGEYNIELRNGDYPAQTIKVKLKPGQVFNIRHAFTDVQPPNPTESK